MQVLHLILLLILYTFGPGHWIVRRFRLAPGERFVVAMGVGFFLVYLLAFGIFAAGMTPMVHLGVTAVVLLFTALGWRDIRAAARSSQIRRMVVAWLCLLGFAALLLAMIRHFGGGTWGGDWVEQYQRSWFFLYFDPDNLGFKFIAQYPLPMRPPMMNVITADVVAQVTGVPEGGNGFELFQITYLWLNSLIFFPCCLIVPRLVRLTPRLLRKIPWTLAAVFAASPIVTQNLTYSWTKLFAGFYAVLAIAVYLKQKAEGGRQKADGSIQTEVVERGGRILSLRLPLAFSLFCIGFLVHFSVGPYAFFVGLHYLLARSVDLWLQRGFFHALFARLQYLLTVWWRRPRNLVEPAVIALTSLLVLSTWFAWSVTHYGSKTTFTSTSAVSDAVVMTPAENVASITRNLGNTLLPTILRDPGLMNSTDLEQPTEAGRIRDFAFLIYQVSLPFALGSVGLPLLLYLLWRTRNGQDATTARERRFWIAFIPVVYVVGVVVYGGTDRFGVVHVCLQPMVLLGLCLIAGGIWRVSIRWRGILLVGLLLDAAIGVFLHMAMQHRLFEIKELFARATDGTEQVIGYQVMPGPDVPSRAAQNNLKNKYELKVSFAGDAFAGLLPVLQFGAGGILAFLLFKGLLGTDRVKPAATAPATPTGKSKRGKRRRHS